LVFSVQTVKIWYKLHWDKTKPDGQPRRMLDNDKATKEFSFKAKTDLKTGLARTVEWFKNNRPLNR
jgi:nucleoside-diphosphate-sugar epimerase